MQEAGLEALSVRLMSLRRANGVVANVDSNTFFQSGDTLVLSGHGEDLALAEQHLAAIPGAEAQ